VNQRLHGYEALYNHRINEVHTKTSYRSALSRVVNIEITIAILFSIVTGIAILVPCLALHVVLQYF